MCHRIIMMKKNKSVLFWGKRRRRTKEKDKPILRFDILLIIENIHLVCFYIEVLDGYMNYFRASPKRP